MVHGIVSALEKVSIDTVVEYQVSHYESHFDKNKSMDGKNAMDEMLMAKSILSELMNNYWRGNPKNGKWHLSETQIK